MKTSEMRGDDRSFLRSSIRPSAPSGSPIRLVDLFCGSGGLTLGLLEACRQLGRSLDIRLAVEADDGIARLFAENFGQSVPGLATRVEDWFDGRLGAVLSGTETAARKVVGPVDILVGGPPCQGHSSLNNHTRGDDPKNALYLAVVRAAEVLEPKSILIENVPAVLRDSRAVVDVAVTRFERLGYTVDSSMVSMTDIGVPQTRKRHVLLARRGGLSVSDALANARTANARTVRWAIGDLVGRTGDTLFDLPSTLTSENLRRARWLQAQGEFDLPNRLRPSCHKDKDDHKYKSMYGRLSWDAPAQTITTGFASPGQGRYLHPSELRTLTPHEAARLQFFPDWFRFHAARNRRVLQHAIGNAVPPKLSFVLAGALVARRHFRGTGGQNAAAEAI